MVISTTFNNYSLALFVKLFLFYPFNPIRTDIFYNLFIPCGVINDPMYIFEDLTIKVKYLSNTFFNTIKVSQCKIRLFACIYLVLIITLSEQ